MWPLAGFAFGAVVGAVGVVMRGSQIAEHARPAVKAMLKATLAATHEARLRQAEVAEAAEDLYAEAEAEVMAERRASAMAAATQAAPSASSVDGEELSQPHVVEAVQQLYKLYAETNGDVTPEKVARIIAASHAKAIAEREAGAAQSSQSSETKRQP
jgi:hypothetical protein